MEEKSCCEPCEEVHMCVYIKRCFKDDSLKVEIWGHAFLFLACNLIIKTVYYLVSYEYNRITDDKEVRLIE